MAEGGHAAGEQNRTEHSPVEARDSGSRADGTRLQTRKKAGDIVSQRRRNMEVQQEK